MSAIRAFSPDGKKIAYLVTEISREENAYRTDLWVYAPRKRRQHAPDAERLRPRLFLGRCRHAHHLENRTWQHDSLPARCRIRFADAAVHASDCSQKIRPLSDGCFAITAVHDSQPEPARYHILDEAPFSSNGQHYTSGRRTALYVYEAASGDLRRLSDETADVDGFTYRAGTLIFQATPWQNYRPYLYSPAFYAYDVKRRETRQLTNVGRINSFALCF